MVGSEIEDTYYIWEQLKSLAFGYRYSHPSGNVYFTTGYFLHYRLRLYQIPGNENAYTEFFAGADKVKSEWPLIKQGMFGGD